MRGPVSEPRRRLIRLAFARADKNGDGALRADDLEAAFHAVRVTRRESVWTGTYTLGRC